MEHTWWQWFADIIIPAAGAIAMPLLVWFLTWYYGAEKAEERKNQRLLNERLNYLYAILQISIKNLDELLSQMSYHEMFMNAFARRNWVEFSDIFDAVNAKDYSLAAHCDSNIIKELIEAKNEYKKLLRSIDKLHEIAAPLSLPGQYQEFQKQMNVVSTQAQNTKDVFIKLIKSTENIAKTNSFVKLADISVQEPIKEENKND